MRTEGLEVIARIRSPFPEKFGVPRQSGLVPEIRSTVVFEEPYRVREALRGLEDFSHIWLIWWFHQAERENWRPTVRPPRLGGNDRMGVFATRSPFRPNPLGLSCVRLLGIRDTEEGPVLDVEGADLVDMTPIVDIKPYLSYTDAREQTRQGFAGEVLGERLEVLIPGEILREMTPCQARAIRALLAQDVRPGYQRDGREYGMDYDGLKIRFRVEGRQARVLSVREETENG